MARCLVTGGRAGYRQRRSSDGFAADACGATHPELEELIVDGRYGTATEVVLRFAPGTGQRCALVDQNPSRKPNHLAASILRPPEAARPERQEYA